MKIYNRFHSKEYVLDQFVIVMTLVLIMTARAINDGIDDFAEFFSRDKQT